MAKVEIDDWAPCCHGETDDEYYELLSNSPELTDIIFCLVIDGDLKILGDQWVGVAWKAPDRSNTEFDRDPDYDIHYFIQGDDPDIALCYLWKLVNENGHLGTKFSLPTRS